MDSHLILRQFWLKTQVGWGVLYGHFARKGHWLPFLLCSMRDGMEILGCLYPETLVSLRFILPLLPRLPGHLEPFYPTSIGSMAFFRSRLSSRRCYCVYGMSSLAGVAFPLTRFPFLFILFYFLTGVISQKRNIVRY